MSRPDRAVFEDPQGSVSYPSGHQIQNRGIRNRLVHDGSGY